MKSTPEKFIQFALEQHILQFGEFTLKSGRQSPYFFNAGLFYTGEQLATLGQFYATTLLEHKLTFALSNQGHNINTSFNRKEAKLHGEKGVIIGAPLKGKRVVMIDDVITAGTAYKESKTLIEAQRGKLAGVIVALDRQEPANLQPNSLKQSTLSLIQERDNIPVLAIAALQDIKTYLKHNHQTEQLQKILSYEASF
jgi:orotate phosphoribosyltransferase